MRKQQCQMFIALGRRDIKWPQGYQGWNGSGRYLPNILKEE